MPFYAYDEYGIKTHISNVVEGRKYYLVDGSPAYVWKPIPPNDKPSAHFKRYERGACCAGAGRRGDEVVYIQDPQALFKHILTKKEVVIPPVRPREPREDFEPHHILGDDVEHIRMVRCNTLRRLWQCGIKDLEWQQNNDAHKYVIFEKWRQRRLWEFEGGQLAVEASPYKVVPEWKELQFRCTWYTRAGELRERFFYLKFKDERLFAECMAALGYRKEEQKLGNLGDWVTDVNTVLIAGDWSRKEWKHRPFWAECVNREQIFVVRE